MFVDSVYGEINFIKIWILNGYSSHTVNKHCVLKFDMIANSFSLKKNSSSVSKQWDDSS